MSRVSQPMLLQAGARGAALALPLIVVAGVRLLAPAEVAASYFTTLTDVVLLSALLKLGVDAYVPTCSHDGRRVFVAGTWRLAWIVVVSALVAASFFLSFMGREWGVPIATAVALSGLLAAEGDRLRARFLTFYLLKAPGAYVAALAVVLAAGIGVQADVVTTLVLATPVLLVARRLVAADDSIDVRALVGAGIVSLLIVSVSWKEALVARWAFQGSDLAALVFFSRLLLLVTFPFMLRNARVPLLMRAERATEVRHAVRRIAATGRGLSLGWAVLASLLVVAYAVRFEPERTVGAGALMAGGVVLVAVGNLVPCLIFLREYGRLIVVHVGALLSFLAALLLLRTSIDDVFLSVSLASLCAQSVFALLLLQQVAALGRRGPLSVASPG